MTGSSSEGSTVGSSADMVGRMRAVMPAAWFPITASSATISAAPVLDSLLSGIGWAWSFCYALANFVIRQARIGTATGNFLDMISSDFFGTMIMRKAAEEDDAFRNRLLANLLLSRATRTALTETLTNFLGSPPNVFEPRRAADTGGYGSTSASGTGGGGGYNTSAIILGSSAMPFQYLVMTNTGKSRTWRESDASFLDEKGALQIAPRHVVRPTYVNGVVSGLLAEPRGFNLIKDSVDWTSWKQSSPIASARWVVDLDGVGALWSGRSVLQISVYSGGEVIGPSVTASVPADTAITASIWIYLPANHSFQLLQLSIGDADNREKSVNSSVDLTITSQWQRVSVTLPVFASTSGEALMALVGTSNALMNLPILTQCWQLEPGTVMTSYIPSNCQVGIREADDLLMISSETTPSVDVGGLNEVINRVIPAGSIAWTRFLS